MKSQAQAKPKVTIKRMTIIPKIVAGREIAIERAKSAQMYDPWKIKYNPKNKNTTLKKDPIIIPSVL